ncbi:MAG TPA: tetratricopeptide repeat protein [Bacteroidetes bacterium]|nr:tetratricopeptide repeat protein [Bacteroidota bacterium]
MAKRKKRKKNKKEDEILLDLTEVTGQAEDFFERNQKTILAAATAIALLVGGYLFYQNFILKPRQMEVVEQMSEAEYQFERDSFGLALANPGGGYPGFADIVKNYSGTDAANAALYYAGVSTLNRGEYDAAISYLEDFDADGELLPIMKQGTLGDAYSEKGDLDKALSLYNKAVSAGDNELLTPYYLKKVAMLSEKLGKTDAALKAWERIKKDYPSSTEAREASKFIVSLK